MAIQRPADARPVAAHAFRGFNGLIGHEVVAWRPGFVEMSLKVRLPATYLKGDFDPRFSLAKRTSTSQPLLSNNGAPQQSLSLTRP